MKMVYFTNDGKLKMKDVICRMMWIHEEATLSIERERENIEEKEYT